MASGDPPLRVRALLVALTVLLVLLTGAALDARRDRTTGVGALRHPPSATGAWFCPHGGGPHWDGWVVVANPNTKPVRVRVSSFSASNPPRVFSFVVAAGVQVYRSVIAADREAATEVEYFGGWVGVAAVVHSSGPHAAVAAERCVRASRHPWFLPDGTTRPGEADYLVVMNPFSQSAQFDVVFRTEQRRVAPGELTPLVLPAARSVAIRVNRFVLASEKEDTVSAEVVPRAGRVVAGSVGVSEDGLRAEAGEVDLQPRWIIPAAGSGASVLALFNPGVRRSQLALVAQGADRQKLLSGLEGVALGGQSVDTYDLGSGDRGGTVVESSNGVPVAVARRLAGAKADVATITGSASAFARWLVLPALPADGGVAYVVVQNPKRAAARVMLRRIREEGMEKRVRAIDVPGGRTMAFAVSSNRNPQPVTVLVEATRGTVVAASASYSLRGLGYASTLGVPIP